MDNSAESEERACFRADMDAKGRLQKRLNQSGQTKSTFRCCPLSAAQRSSSKSKDAVKTDSKEDKIYRHLKKTLFTNSLTAKGQKTVKGKRGKGKEELEDEADSKELGDWQKVSHDEHRNRRKTGNRKSQKAQKERKATSAGFDLTKFLIWWIGKHEDCS